MHYFDVGMENTGCFFLGRIPPTVGADWVGIRRFSFGMSCALLIQRNDRICPLLYEAYGRLQGGLEGACFFIQVHA